MSALQAHAPMADGEWFSPKNRPSSASPIDLVHLASQTCGDRALERSVLSMLARQIRIAEAQLRALPTKDRATLAHGLKGTARNVGAFALAEAAAEFERGPGNAAAFASLIDHMTTTRRFATDCA